MDLTTPIFGFPLYGWLTLGVCVVLFVVRGRLIGLMTSSSAPSQPQQDNSTRLLTAILGHEFTVGTPSRDNDGVDVIEISELRGRQHLNARTKLAAGIGDLKGTRIQVVRTKTLEPVGVMTLGVQGSVVFSDLDLNDGVTLKDGERLRIDNQVLAPATA